jgi:signal transduction histidine kinase
MADFVLTALQKMNNSADTTERLRLAANTLQTLGWRHTVIVGYEAGPRLLVVTPGGALYSAKPSDIEAWKLENVPPDDAQSITLPVRLPDNTLVGIIRLETPANDKVNTPENRRAVDLIAFNIGNVFELRRIQALLQQSRDQLTEQVDELMILQSMDEELNSSLNLENVIMLAADWALRRTRSRSVIFAVTAPDGDGLVPLVSLGFPRGMLPFNTNHPMPFTFGVLGQAVSAGRLVYIPDTAREPDIQKILPNIRSQLAIPLEMQGRLLGVLALESERVDHYDSDDVEFVKRLAARASVALDNARLYNAAAASAEQSRSLYIAGRAISSTLEREEILPRIAQSIALVVDVAAAIVADYRLDRNTSTVLTAWRVPTIRTTPDLFPAPGTILDLNMLPYIYEAIEKRRTVVIHASQELSPLERELLARWDVKSLLALPMFVGDEIVGLVLALETRSEHRFTHEEILLFEALASQSAVAFRQAKLFEDVRELENLKSEMIRMASHDLRNPLGNVLGYIELISITLGGYMTEEDREYLIYMRKSATTMKSIIDDLLTLEKIESERQHAWTKIDFGTLIHEVYDAQKATAELKHHALLFEYEGEPLYVLGSTTQLRQAAVNLIGNGLKYTRDGGRVVIRLRAMNHRIYFEVEDNGYGISPERQKRLFQRFYRAKQPGTEEIPGTGLGLSMVKTVIERHGGEVWMRSTEGYGSTFGFWLPDAESMSVILRNQHIELDSNPADGAMV